MRRNAVEDGRVAREIWAKRLGFKVKTVALNPDGTRPDAKKQAELANAIAAAAKPTTKSTEKK